jgi:hypothetical protein
VKRHLVALAAFVAASCAPTHRADRIPPGEGPLIGIYKAVASDGDGTARNMKLSIWATRPDRLHVEVMGPVGGVHFVIDAGGGRACVIDVDGATAFVGEDDPSAFDALVGIHVSAEDAVGALLSGTSPGGWTVERDGPVEALPKSLRIDDGASRLVLTRTGLLRGAATARGLGSGEPPASLPVRPLAEIADAIRRDR